MTPSVHLTIEPAAATRAAEIDHAFRTWAATRCFAVAPTADAADVTLTYGGSDPDSLPAADWTPTLPSRHDGLPWMYGPGPGGRDSLAEVHAWTAARSELDGRRDEIGRLTFESTMPGHLGVDPRIPWASRHLDRFDQEVLARRPALASVLGGPRPTTVTILGSHDLDFLPSRERDAVARVVKNIGVALVTMRDPRLALTVGTSAAVGAARRRPILGGVGVVAELERRHDIRSTWNVLVTTEHARDANYDHAAPGPRTLLRNLADAGHEIGLHGGYLSSTREGGLAAEALALRRAGHEVVGARQHWLRHDGLSIWGAVELAELHYDSSGGWSDEVGFRHGMAEPFVPFDLLNGAPARILEVPLVAMDVALSAVARGGSDPLETVHGVLDEAADHRGAVSVLWHDTVFSDTQLRRGVAAIYEALMHRGDRWATTHAEVEARRARWAAAGLPIGSVLEHEMEAIRVVQ